MPEQQLIPFCLVYFDEDLAADLDILLGDLRKKFSVCLMLKRLILALNVAYLIILQNSMPIL